MKKIIAILLLVTFLSSCGEEVLEKTVQKTDFFVDTTLGSDFSGETVFEKIGKVTSSQDISLNANANGRVSSVSVKNGDTVRAGQIIARLEDNIGNYGISIQRASNSIERAKISYESNKISLDKQVFDAELNLEKLERNLVALKSDGEQNLLLAQDNLNNSQYDGLDSTSALQLQQLDNNIEKSKLDYDIKLIADMEQVEGYKASLKKDYNSLLILLDDIIEFSDEILGVTELNRDENNNFEDFLGAKDSSQKSISEKSLLDLIGYRQSLDFTSLDLELQSADISETRMIEIIDYINVGYESSKTLLNNLETTLNNSVKSVGQLGDVELASFLGSTNGYQSQLQGNYGGFISSGSAIKTFLRTYKNSQASILKGIELQEKDKVIQLKNLTSGELSATAGFERTVISIEDNIKNLESQVKTAQTISTMLKKREM